MLAMAMCLCSSVANCRLLVVAPAPGAAAASAAAAAAATSACVSMLITRSLSLILVLLISLPVCSLALIQLRCELRRTTANFGERAAGESKKARASDACVVGFGTEPSMLSSRASAFDWRQSRMRTLPLNYNSVNPVSSLVCSLVQVFKELSWLILPARMQHLMIRARNELPFFLVIFLIQSPTAHEP